MKSGLSTKTYSGGVKVKGQPDVGNAAAKKERSSGRGITAGMGRSTFVPGGATP